MYYHGPGSKNSLAGTVNPEDGRTVYARMETNMLTLLKDKKGHIPMDENKSKALAAALAQIEKQFGKGSIMRMDSEVVPDIAVVSTGSLGLDIALGVGGLPRGRVVEIYGPESSGKTTLTLQVIAEMQKMGGTAAFIDAENALDAQYAGKLGVKVDDLLISQPDNGEQALEIADMLVRSGSIDVKVASPFREAIFDILYGKGISREGEILELGVLHGIVEKSGAWYNYKKDRIGQGKDNSRDFLIEHPEMAQEIEALIRAKVGVNNPAALAAAEAAAA